MFSWPVARQRKYTLLRHKAKTGPMSTPLNLFSRLFLEADADAEDAEHDVPQWDIFFVAGPRELQGELLWAAGRPQSLWCEESTSNDDRPSPLNPDDFFKVLTSTERGFLDKYRSIAPGQVYQLNQNPEVTGVISKDKNLATIIKNAGVLW